MTSTVEDLKLFLGSPAPLALVQVAGTRGSTPREKGAFMLVSAEGIHGTIGGGQLEYMAIDKARQMLRAVPFRKAGGETERIDVQRSAPRWTCRWGRRSANAAAAEWRC